MPAFARGFCNIDSLGSKDLQQEVGNAAAAFFDGGSFLMAMLGAFERKENNKGKEIGSESGKAFNTASRLYKTVKMPENIDKRLAEVTGIREDARVHFPARAELQEKHQDIRFPQTPSIFLAC
jgi:hypothetical protein